MKINYKTLKIEVDDNVMYDLAYVETYAKIIKLQNDKSTTAQAEMLLEFKNLFNILLNDKNRDKAYKWIKKENNGRIDVRVLADMVASVQGQLNALEAKKK